MPEVYHRFNVPPKVQTACGRSLADSSFVDECDINNIVKRYTQTGMWPANSRNNPVFADLSLIPEDLMAARQKIDAAERAFSELPSGVRERFSNSYIALLQFLEDPANAAEAVELGLLRKEAAPSPDGESSTAP